MQPVPMKPQSPYQELPLASAASPSELDLAGGLHRSVLLICLGLVLTLISGCALLKTREEPLPERNRLLRLQRLIKRIGSPEIFPTKGEKFYPFTSSFQKAEGDEVIRKGEGFVLVHGPLWCLVQRWRDSKTGNPGQRMLIVDRSQKKLEAEVRQWPEGSRGQRWNHWTCLRFQDSVDQTGASYFCEYYYPEGTERIVYSPGNWGFYDDLVWNGDGLLERMTRFGNSFVHFTYDGLRVKRIDFDKNGTIITFINFSYE